MVSGRVLPALQVAGYLLATTIFTHKLAGDELTDTCVRPVSLTKSLYKSAHTDDEENQILQSLVTLLHAITRKVSLHHTESCTYRALQRKSLCHISTAQQTGVQQASDGAHWLVAHASALL